MESVVQRFLELKIYVTFKFELKSDIKDYTHALRGIIKNILFLV